MKKMIKSLLAVMLILSLAFTLGSCGKKKDLLETIQERGYIIIATEGVWSPWTYHDESGKLTGFDVEMGRLIAEKLGVEARFEETAWEAILAGVDSGRFDIACNGVGYTEERAKSYMFSDPYLYTSAVLLVQSSNTERDGGDGTGTPHLG